MQLKHTDVLICLVTWWCYKCDILFACGQDRENIWNDIGFISTVQLPSDNEVY